jgi:exopolyphosphatase / guanosine-5'-triphosphate,3'-diphosphate pyrophosphatase
VRRACIDIGSNTTRLLVAECEGDNLLEIHQERAFTHIGRGLLADGTIGPEKIREVVAVVASQVECARELGAHEIWGVGTAAIRRAGNGALLVDAIEAGCGLQVEILGGEDEARLAFVGAARTLDHVPTGSLGVVDVGGGSSELVVGALPDAVTWWTSLAIGSGDIAHTYLLSDPPSLAQLEAARDRIQQAIAGLEAPHPTEAVAVGGSATSLRRLAGPLLDADAFRRSLRLLSTEHAGDVASRFALDIDRVRLLPAGLLLLQAASQLLRAPLRIARGGVREGILLEANS